MEAEFNSNCIFNFFRKFNVLTSLLLPCFCYLLLFSPSNVFAESKKDLEKKKEQLQKDIEYTNQLLSQTKKVKSASLNQLITLNKKISYRTELIQTIHTQINLVDNQIGHVSGQIDSLDHRLSDLKSQYASMLYYAYKNQGLYSRLMFVFSSGDFNQAYKRMKYMQQLSEYRIHQHDLIVSVQDSLGGKKKEFQFVVHEKTQLLGSHQKEKKQLDQEKVEQVHVLNNLASREKKLHSELQEKQRQEQ